MDSLERVWARAAFPPQSTVLNLRLRPYSCGHELLLARAGSPLVNPGGKAEDITWDDIFLAVLICSQDFSDGCAMMDRGHPGVALWAWKGVLKLNRKLSLTEEANKFAAYLHASTWTPDTNSGGGGTSRTLKAPRVWRMVPFLCDRLGMSEAEAWDYPLVKASLVYAAEMDRLGHIDLAGGREETALINMVEEMDARAAKGDNAWES